MPHVLHAFISLMLQYTAFPNTTEGKTTIMRKFHTIAGFSNVIAAIDCPHIAIKSPSLEELTYVDRKDYHIVNVQVICDVQLTFLNIITNDPGGTYDSFIVQHSTVGI